MSSAQMTGSRDSKRRQKRRMQPECFGKVGNAGVVSLLLSVNGAWHFAKF